MARSTKGREEGQFPALAVHRVRIGSSCRCRVGTERMAQLVVSSSFLHKRWDRIVYADGSPHIALSILPFASELPLAVEAFSFLAFPFRTTTPGRCSWVRELGALSQKENPRQSTHA